MKKMRQVGYFQEFVTRCTVNKIQNIKKIKYKKRVCGTGGIIPLILNITTRWRWVVSLRP